MGKHFICLNGDLEYSDPITGDLIISDTRVIPLNNSNVRKNYIFIGVDTYDSLSNLMKDGWNFNQTGLYEKGYNYILSITAKDLDRVINKSTAKNIIKLAYFKWLLGERFVELETLKYIAFDDSIVREAIDDEGDNVIHGEYNFKISKTSVYTDIKIYLTPWANTTISTSYEFTIRWIKEFHRELKRAMKDIVKENFVNIDKIRFSIGSDDTNITKNDVKNSLEMLNGKIIDLSLDQQFYKLQEKLNVY